MVVEIFFEAANGFLVGHVLKICPSFLFEDGRFAEWCGDGGFVGFYVLLKHFVHTIISPAITHHAVNLTEELAAFDAACKVIDVILLLKRVHGDAPHRLELLDTLQVAIDRAIASYIACYGTACQTQTPPYAPLDPVNSACDTLIAVVQDNLRKKAHFFA